MNFKKTIAIMINNKHYIYGHKIKLKTTIFYLSNLNIKLKFLIKPNVYTFLKNMNNQYKYVTDNNY